MLMKLKMKAIGLAVAIIIGISGCGIIQKDTTEGKVIDGKEVIAVVNGENILKSDFDSQVNQVKSALEANGQDFSTDEGKKNLQEIKKKVLDSMIKDVLSLQQAKKENVTLKPNQMQEAVSQLETYHGGKDALDNYLKQQGMDWKSFEKLLQDQLIINNLKEKLTANVKVSDEDVKKYFDSNKDMFKLPSPEIRASHILVPTEDEANKVLAEIKAGEDFAELAKKYSTDPGSKDKGGDLGYFGKGKMVPEFEKAAFALKQGEVSQPVKTQFGYHIIKVTGERTSLSFDDVKDYIKSNLLTSKKDEEFNKFLDQWQKQSKIEKYL
ncbi:peptidylprolyl isomerase [Thermoanaerobacteraceae bacterium SP2]|jgi:parvulin-like peptidyl-prolyl isomerase|nr:peptidylprolyl isomerase [Thermoanaerobacteraceae bacterium SP2]